jgi:hypothetical protein
VGTPDSATVWYLPRGGFGWGWVGGGEGLLVYLRGLGGVWSGPWRETGVRVMLGKNGCPGVLEGGFGAESRA